jgi:hypothetical protein
VYGEPIPETRAVHNLEHAYVVIYYRPEAEGGVSADAVEGLATLARDQSRVLMAPYPELPEGTALALVAWNTRWQCPPAVTTEQAVTIARGSPVRAEARRSRRRRGGSSALHLRLTRSDRSGAAAVRGRRSSGESGDRAAPARPHDHALLEVRPELAAGQRCGRPTGNPSFPRVPFDR